MTGARAVLITGGTSGIGLGIAEALVGNGRSLALELTTTGVTVNCVAPGPVRTPLNTPPEGSAAAPRTEGADHAEPRRGHGRDQ